MRRLSVLLVALVTLGACSIPSPTVPDAAVLGSEGDFPLGGDLQSFATSINAERVRSGGHILKVNGALVWAAQLGAAQEAARGTTAASMPGAQYPELADRLRAAGYTASLSGQLSATGDVVQTAGVVVTGWSADGPARSTMLDGGYSDMGVAIAADSQGRRYFLAVFAHP